MERERRCEIYFLIKHSDRFTTVAVLTVSAIVCQDLIIERIERERETRSRAVDQLLGVVRHNVFFRVR